MKKMAAGQQRKLERTAHLLAGVILVGYVYVPAPSLVQELVRFLVFPLLVASGLAMWQAPRIRRLRRAARRWRHARSPRLQVPAGRHLQHQRRAAPMHLTSQATASNNSSLPASTTS